MFEIKNNLIYIKKKGLKFTDMDLITPLAEYRNGGLLVDTGVLTPIHESTYEREVDVGSELVVEVFLFFFFHCWCNLKSQVLFFTLFFFFCGCFWLGALCAFFFYRITMGGRPSGRSNLA